jgi:hypothetical protein
MAAAKNPALDFFSTSFDPLLALSTQNLEPPLKNVQPRDNITRCLDLLPENDPQFREQKQTAPDPNKPRPLSRAAIEKRAKQQLQDEALKKAQSVMDSFSTQYNPAFGRFPNFNIQKPPNPMHSTQSASALATLSSSSSKINSSSPASSSSSDSSKASKPRAPAPPITGPLTLIQRLCVSKQRARVYLRRGPEHAGMRGYCDAYIKAFDKHFNMVQ